MILILAYIVLCVVTLNICIEGARHMQLSLRWAIFWGILFAPASGIAYFYMWVSEDRTLWRVVLVTAVVYVVAATIVAALLGLQ
jgi:hypothetical protein